MIGSNKQTAEMYNREKFNLSKLNELEVRKQRQIEISNRFAALENLVIAMKYIELRRTLKRISKSQLESLGLHELKLLKTWFDEECLGFLDQRKQAKT
jgi:hypothetical protein